MTVKERLEALRILMKEKGVDAYLVPTDDFHGSEYVGDYFKARKYMSGFTGSAGTLVVTAKEACLWTDGRYFIQAANQLKDTTVTLMKMGEEGTPAIEDYLYNVVPAKGKLGFDGRVMTAALGRALIERLADKKAVLSTGEDLVGMIWEDRPALSAEPAFLLDEKYTGKSTLQKLTDLRNQMKENGCTVHIITTLDDIAWLFNIRGNDVECNPVVLSYAVIGLGQFGMTVALTLADAGCDVLAIDDREENVQDIAEKVSYAVKADVKEPGILQSVGVQNVDVAVIAVAENMEASIIAAMQVKELGVPFVMAKAMNALHGRILEKIGADKVIYPEQSMGVRVARNLLSSGFLDTFELSPEFSMAEFKIPDSWIGKTLRDLKIREKNKINLVGLKQGNDVDINPNPAEPLPADCTVMAIGKNEDLNKVSGN